MAAHSFELEHGSDMWRRWRAGRINCSKFLNIMTTGPNGWGAPALAYCDEVCTGIITGEGPDEIEAPSTDWGKRWEPVAREEYSAFRAHQALSEGKPFNGLARKPGVVFYKPGTGASGSTDGLIDPNGGMEIKCPKDKRVHFRTIVGKVMPTEHIPQVMGYMWLTERDWWDFCSYDPRYPEDVRLFIQRIHRNDTYITNLALRVQQFSELIRSRLKAFGYNGDPFTNDDPPTTGEPVVSTEREAPDGERPTGAGADR